MDRDEGPDSADERLERSRREAQAAKALLDKVSAQAEADLGSARKSLADASRRIENLSGELAAIRASSSWRLTAPLRRAMTAFPQLHALIAGAAKLAWWSVTFQLGPRLRARRDFLRIQAEARQARLRPHRVARPGEATRPTSVPPPPRTEPADVIVCVHNALADVQVCLASVLAHTRAPYRLILVDDGSGAETQGFLAAFAAEYGATLVRNDQARGYTFAANQGMRAATSPWLVLLNSDTVVTEGWLERMTAHAEAGVKVGMVGPMSNTASWQSAPKIYENGDWADNPLPPGVGVADMGRLAAAASPGQAVPLPFLNGFCMALRRAMLDEVGLFDEATFGAGYGEENDLSIRARNSGWGLVVASDAYVFHAQSKSYSHERRKALAERAGQNLAAKHDAARDIEPQVEFCRTSPAMAGTRARIGAALERERLSREGRALWAGRRVAFVLPVDREGGGANVVRQEIAALTRMGVDCRIVNLEKNRSDFSQSYPDLIERTLFLRSREDVAAALADPAHGFDAAIATYYASVLWLPPEGTLRLGYYIQDYEPFFFAEGDVQRQIAGHSYVAHEDMALFTKSRWNAATVARHHDRTPAAVGPSVDIDLFRPLPRDYAAPTGPVKVCAMVRPATAHRGPKRTLEVLSHLQTLFGDAVEVSIFGCDDDQLGQLETPIGGATNYQRLDRRQMAWLLERSDVFLDLSDYQAMGLTALEAMASGCAAVVPVDGGAVEFAQHERNALVIDTTELAECKAAAERLVRDAPLRRALQAQAAEDACLYPPETAAYRMMQALFPA